MRAMRTNRDVGARIPSDRPVRRQQSLLLESPIAQHVDRENGDQPLNIMDSREVDSVIDEKRLQIFLRTLLGMKSARIVRATLAELERMRRVDQVVLGSLNPFA